MGAVPRKNTPVAVVIQRRNRPHQFATQAAAAPSLSDPLCRRRTYRRTRLSAPALATAPKISAAPTPHLLLPAGAAAPVSQTSRPNPAPPFSPVVAPDHHHFDKIWPLPCVTCALRGGTIILDVEDPHRFGANIVAQTKLF